MSRINLNKHKAELEKAWADLHKQNSKNDWVIFGYDGKTFDLKIVGTGDDGFEEMVEDLSDGKILYAGCRVKDPNTSLPKILFVNWQGEGVPTNVKGTCANHIRDVTNLFRGAHVTINARSEDDLDYDAILEKVKKSSGSNYSVHKEKPKPAEKIKPVGAVYKRINPEAEIDVGKRDTFWSKQEQDEKNRVEQEKTRLHKEREEEDRKRKEREAKEAAVREEAVRERSRSIDQQRAAQRALEQKRKEEEKRKYEETLKSAEQDDREFRSRSDSERRKRLQEAQSMIRKRQNSFGDERQRFEAPAQQKAPPPTIPKKTVRKPVSIPAPRPAEPTPQPVEPVRQSIEPEPLPVETVHQPAEPVQPMEPTVAAEQEPEHMEEETTPSQQPPVQDQFYDEPPEEQVPAQSDNVYETLDDSPAQPEQAEPQLQTEQQEDLYDTVAEETPSSQEIAKEDNFYDTVSDDQAPAQAAVTSSGGMTVKALFDYQAEGEDEITFDPGDIITNVDAFDEGWWRGTGPDGKHGIFPSNYVEVISDENKSDENPNVAEESQAPATQGVKARALYDYQASDDTEITFDPDDIITDIEQIDEGWWRGTGPNGQFGLFPANYVELI